MLFYNRELAALVVVELKRGEFKPAYLSQFIQGYENPMGVATYKTAEDVRKVLPSEEELRRVMDEKDCLK